VSVRVRRGGLESKTPAFSLYASEACDEAVTGGMLVTFVSTIGG
jgi:hypothetical protein